MFTVAYGLHRKSTKSLAPTFKLRFGTSRNGHVAHFSLLATSPCTLSLTDDTLYLTTLTLTSGGLFIGALGSCHSIQRATGHGAKSPRPRHVVRAHTKPHTLSRFRRYPLPIIAHALSTLSRGRVMSHNILYVAINIHCFSLTLVSQSEHMPRHSHTSASSLPFVLANTCF